MSYARDASIVNSASTEAALALITFAFGQLRIKQVVATTCFENIGSQAVMRKLGMKIEKNPLGEPAWLQVVGVLKNSD